MFCLLKVIKYVLPIFLKYNSKREEQVTLLTISNKMKWCLSLYELSSFVWTKKKKKTWITYNSMWKKYFCNVVMPSGDTKILELNQ